MQNLDRRVQALEDMPESSDARILRAARTHDFSFLTEAELDTCIAMAEAELRAGGHDDSYFAAVDLKLARLSPEQLKDLSRGLLPWEEIP